MGTPHRDCYSNDYDDITRWNSYWCQIESVKELPVEKLLEIGIGNKTVSQYLALQGYQIVTLDVNKKLNPDVVGDVRELPFANDEFDATICCQVLEHIPFENVGNALKEMRRISRYSIISLPYFNAYISVTVDTNFSAFLNPKRFKPKNLVVHLPFPLRHKFDGAHHWEIGKKSYAIRMIRELFRRSGLKIIKEKTPPLNAPHRFFVLQKANSAID